jgi:alkylhydroperoxidase/carboxymuconolactone decarboxylase family protein YurZ
MTDFGIASVGLACAARPRVAHETENGVTDGHAPSHAFELFAKQSPGHARAWLSAAQGLAQASALDRKTLALSYLAVLAALRLDSGVPFHVAEAREAGASRDEVISAILVGLPAAGNAVIQILPAAIEAFDRR